MPAEILKMSHISKAFSHVTVLKDVNFSLQKGEVHVLIGENGAGKSTLMKILTGVYQQDEGTIELADDSGELKKVEIKKPQDALDLGISMVFQEFNLMENMNIAENIFIGREPVKNFTVDFNKMHKDAQRELERVKLNVPTTRTVESLTVAEKQCVEIAKCISYNARVIILDEPTSSLSETEVDALFKLIDHLKNEGISIIYISHRMEEIFEIGDRITVLRDGEYIDTLKISETNPDHIVQLMIGREFTDEQTELISRKQNEPILVCKDLTVGRFKSKVNFQAYAGEVVGIFGLVGAGRTELANTIFGIDPIREGEILFKGKKIEKQTPEKAIKQGIGLVPEDRKLLGLNMIQNIRENLSLIKLSELSFFRFSKKDESNLTKKYIKKLSIAAHSENQNVNHLSGGNQQKIVISKWLPIHTDVLIMDEPTRGIDVGAKAEIYSLIHALAEEGKSIIVISSDLPEILRISHRVVVMHDGEITFDMENVDLTQEMIMNAALK